MLAMFPYVPMYISKGDAHRYTNCNVYVVVDLYTTWIGIHRYVQTHTGGQHTLKKLNRKIGSLNIAQ